MCEWEMLVVITIFFLTKRGKEKKKIKRDNIDFVRKLSDCLVWFNMWPEVDFCV